jgi:hypothetical protein
LMVVRAGKTRYAAVDRLLEQLPRERMLGVVLNRAERSIDEAAYYYQQQRYTRPEAAEEVDASDDDGDLEMIYIEDDVVS